MRAQEVDWTTESAAGAEQQTIHEKIGAFRAFFSILGICQPIQSMWTNGFEVIVIDEHFEPDYFPLRQLGYDALLGVEVIQAVEAGDVELNNPDRGVLSNHRSAWGRGK